MGATADAERLVAALRRRGQTLATAESLTGGLLGALVTAVPGSSAVYRGGVVAYATDLKADLLGVHPGTLDRLGPVAADTAAEMAVGAARRCRADWALATTGVAGPEPQDGHPVGQVYVAVAGPDGTTVTELALTGDRQAIRTETADRALALALDRVAGAAAVPP